MADEEFHELAVYLEDAAVAGLETFVEAIVEDAEECEDRTDRSDDEFEDIFSAVPAENHE